MNPDSKIHTLLYWYFVYYTHTVTLANQCSYIHMYKHLYALHTDTQIETAYKLHNLTVFIVVNTIHCALFSFLHAYQIFTCLHLC